MVTPENFLFDRIISLEKLKKEVFEAANNFDAALTNSSWHKNANDARMRSGHLGLKWQSLIRMRKPIHEQEIHLRKLEETLKHPWKSGLNLPI